MKEDFSRGKELVFFIKSRLLILRRSVQNLFVPIKQHKTPKAAPKSTPLIEISTILFTSVKPSENYLRLGKIENLRICARKLNGIFVPKGEIFSFWRQIGIPLAAQGFVEGREMRHGCLIPTIAGGICQLSSSLYHIARNSNQEIIERYGHTKLVEGAVFGEGQDANVYWNYIDFRFRAVQDLILKVRLSQSNLIVGFEAIINE